MANDLIREFVSTVTQVTELPRLVNLFCDGGVRIDGAQSDEDGNKVLRPWVRNGPCWMFQKLGEGELPLPALEIGECIVHEAVETL